MSDKPILVALSAITSNGKILLLKRPKGYYKGLWSLPGGKIEDGKWRIDT